MLPPDPFYGSGIVFGTLPSFLPAGVCASVGGSALRPAAYSEDHPFRVVLTVAAGLGRFLVLSIGLPWP